MTQKRDTAYYFYIFCEGQMCFSDEAKKALLHFFQMSIDTKEKTYKDFSITSPKEREKPLGNITR